MSPEEIEESSIAREVRVNTDAIERQEKTHLGIINFLRREVERARERCKHRLWDGESDNCPTCGQQLVEKGF
jgi:hypothetical protein